MNSVQRLVELFSGFAIDKNDLTFISENDNRIEDEISKYFDVKCKSQNVIQFTLLEKQIFALVFPTGYEPQGLNIQQSELMKPCATILEELNKMIRKQQLDLCPIQLYQFLRYRKEYRYMGQIQIKPSKWSNNKKIIVKSKPIRVNKGDISYLFFYNNMMVKDFQSLFKLWENVAITSDIKESDFYKPRQLVERSGEMLAPIIEMPSLGTDTRDLNEAFKHSPEREIILDSVFKYISQSEEYNHWNPARFTNQPVGFHTFLDNVFPRLSSRWSTLSLIEKECIYILFLNLKRNKFALYYLNGPNGFPFIHGDEWGGNFHLNKENKLFLIDFEDSISLDLNNQSISKDNHVMFSHLYRRIYLNTDDDKVYKNEYIGRKDTQFKNIELYPIFEINRSMGRLICSLIQFYTFNNQDLIQNGSDEILTNYAEDIIHKLNSIDNRGAKKSWMLLSIIDWALFWELRKPESQLNSNTVKNKFIIRKKFTDHICQIVYDSKEDYYFEGMFLQYLREKILDIDSGKIYEEFRGLANKRYDDRIWFEQFVDNPQMVIQETEISRHVSPFRKVIIDIFSHTGCTSLLNDSAFSLKLKENPSFFKDLRKIREINQAEYEQIILDKNQDYDFNPQSTMFSNILFNQIFNRLN